MMKTEKQKMLAGELYRVTDPELQLEQTRNFEWLAQYNLMMSKSPEERHQKLREHFGDVGDKTMVRPPFHCDYGYNIRLGQGVFLNFNCVILDVVEVSIGDDTHIGPGVQILTADHPRLPHERESGLEFGKPIRIGRNVWIGAGALIMPGVTIGDGALIGAGSVVTRDVSPGITVVGNPARSRT